MKGYILSSDAKNDLLEIWDYLADNASIEIANRVLADIEDGIEKLVEAPFMGHHRNDLTDRPVRFWAVHSYLLVYLPDDQPLVVARVLYGARDVSNLLDH